MIFLCMLLWLAYELGQWRGEVLQNRRWVAALKRHGLVENLDVLHAEVLSPVQSSASAGDRRDGPVFRDDVLGLRTHPPD